MANAYTKKEDYKNACTYYQKSLSEFRDPQVLNKLKDVSNCYKNRY